LSVELLEGVCVSKDVVEKAKQYSVKDIEVTPQLITGVVTSSNGKTKYSPSVKSNGEYNCGCAGMQFHKGKLCSHVTALLEKAGESSTPFIKAILNNTVFKQEESQSKATQPAITTVQYVFRYLQTSLKGFNELVGGLPIGSPMSIYGPHQAGKTILLSQLGYDVTRQLGGNMLIVDDEGSGFSYMAWKDIFDKRFNVSTNLVFARISQVEKGAYKLETYPKQMPSGHCMIIADVRGIEKILALHGRHCRLEIKGDKLALTPVEDGWVSDIRNTPMYKLCKEFNVKYLAYDSVTTPMLEFGSERQNFPVRANAASLWLIQVEKIAEELGLVVTASLHETFDPANPYSRPQHTGGRAVGYTFKFVTYMSHVPSKRTPHTESRPETVRELWIERHVAKAPWQNYKFIQLTDNGFVDYTGGR